MSPIINIFLVFVAGHARSVAELRRRMLNLQQRAVGDQTWARAGPGITTMVVRL